jgi:hypothetical protein
VTAATLHDTGYEHPDTGYPPLDGARFLPPCGFSRTVCHLVAHHSASIHEAEERGIDLEAYEEVTADRDDLGPAHVVLWWADMTHGPQGQELPVGERLDDILKRYGSEEVVARSAARIRPILLAASDPWSVGV